MAVPVEVIPGREDLLTFWFGLMLSSWRGGDIATFRRCQGWLSEGGVEVKVTAVEESWPAGFDFRLVRGAELARMFLWRRGRVMEMYREGRIPGYCFKPGGAVWFNPHEVLAYMRAKWQNRLLTEAERTREKLRREMRYQKLKWRVRDQEEEMRKVKAHLGLGEGSVTSFEVFPWVG